MTNYHWQSNQKGRPGQDDLVLLSKVRYQRNAPNYVTLPLLLSAHINITYDGVTPGVWGGVFLTLLKIKAKMFHD